jgi:hypothetical protein
MQGQQIVLFSPIYDEDSLPDGGEVIAVVKNTIESVAQVEPVLSLTGRSIREVLNTASVSESPSPTINQHTTPQANGTPSASSSADASQLGTAEAALAGARQNLAKSTTTSAAIKKALEDWSQRHEQKIRRLKNGIRHPAV